MDPHAGAVASGESAGDEDDGSGEHETHPTSSAPSANSRPRKRSRLTAAADESTTVDDCSAGGSGSGSGDGGGGGGESVGAWPYDESAARDELVTLIVSQDLPVGIAGSASFETMVRQAFCPQFERIDNAVTIRDILVFHEDHVAGLKEEFTGGDLSFALSCEIWGTSYHRMSYLCVAAHYVDGDHILNKRVIGFKLIDGAPTAEAMARRILDVAMEYGIENRIVSVTLGDGLADAETMDALAPLLGWYTGGFVFLQRCIFSILNDIVRAGLAEMAGPLDAIRSAAVYVSSSEANFAEFEKCCVERGQKARKLWPDSKVRWDSTYDMLKEVLPYKEVLTDFVNGSMQQEFLSEHNWSLLSIFHKFLTKFYKAATKLSVVYSQTSSLTLIYICDMAVLFRSFRTDPVFSAILKPMEAVFVKYFQRIPRLYCYALILDPRLKLHGLDVALKMLGEALNIDYSSTFTQIADEFLEVLSMYEEKFGSTLRPPPSLPSSLVFRLFAARLKELELKELELQKDSSPSSSVHQRKAKNEFNKKYIETPCSLRLNSRGPDPNIIMWWKDNKLFHVVLAQLARDVLASPVSTVSSADAFNINGRVVEDQRSCLAPDILEAIMCLKDFENAATREQDRMVNAEFASVVCLDM